MRAPRVGAAWCRVAAVAVALGSCVASAGEPLALVAMGDGLVAVPPPSMAPTPAGSGAEPPAGWVSVLADCLEERTPSGWSVVDRAVEGETAASARGRVAAVRELAPRLVLVGVGAREIADAEADAGAFRAELTALLGELRAAPSAPGVLLVGMIAPTLEGDAPQQAIDARTGEWNRVLHQIAADTAGIRHVDLWTVWPREPDERRRLTADGWHLSPQGHARVAALVCDSVVGWATANPVASP